MFGKRSTEAPPRRTVAGPEVVAAPVEVRSADAKVTALEPRAPAKAEPVIHERRHSEEVQIGQSMNVETLS